MTAIALTVVKRLGHRVVVTVTVAAVVLAAGCAVTPGGGDNVSQAASVAALDSDPSCDQAFDRLKKWAQGIIQPATDGDREEFRRLAAATEADCSEPSAADDKLTRADAALAAAYAFQRRFDAATALLQGALQSDSPESMMVLANLLGQGMGGDKDQAQAAQLLDRAAAIGGTDYSIRAAREYLDGFNVAADQQRARELYRAAIEQDSAPAMIAYALDYLGLFRAELSPAATEQALALVRRAADELNSGDAMTTLTVFYLSDRGRDLAQAEQWADKALTTDSSRAFYAKGLVAFFKFRQAAAGQQLDDYSQFPDGIEASKWFRRGAEAGDPRSATYLGRLYAVGVGVPRDRVAAERWLMQARAAGDRESAALLRELRGANAAPAS